MFSISKALRNCPRELLPRRTHRLVAHINEVIRLHHDTRFMFYNDHSVALVTQTFQDANQTLVISWVQSGRGFVQNIEVSTNEEPSAVVRLTRWTSPLDKVRD